jgi:thiol:disulfide interchange protein
MTSIRQLAINVLKVAAWIALIGGLVVAAGVWADAIRTATRVFGGLDELSAADVTVGFAVLFGGMLQWAVLFVFANLAEDISQIARNASVKSGEASSDITNK